MVGICGEDCGKIVSYGLYNSFDAILVVLMMVLVRPIIHGLWNKCIA